MLSNRCFPTCLTSSWSSYLACSLMILNSSHWWIWISFHNTWITYSIHSSTRYVLSFKYTGDAWHCIIHIKFRIRCNRWTPWLFSLISLRLKSILQISIIYNLLYPLFLRHDLRWFLKGKTLTFWSIVLFAWAESFVWLLFFVMRYLLNFHVSIFILMTVMFIVEFFLSLFLLLVLVLRDLLILVWF